MKFRAIFSGAEQNKKKIFGHVKLIDGGPNNSYIHWQPNCLMFETEI